MSVAYDDGHPSLRTSRGGRESNSQPSRRESNALAARLKPNSITLFSSLARRRPAGDQIPLRYPACDQLASRSTTSSRAGRRAASEHDSVMEYGLNRSATRFELSRHVEIARTCLQQVGNHVCDLDSVMEFSLKRVADQFANQLASLRAS